jgi:hypothetical protein
MSLPQHYLIYLFFSDSNAKQTEPETGWRTERIPLISRTAIVHVHPKIDGQTLSLR